MKCCIQGKISMVYTINLTVYNVRVFLQSCFQLSRIEQLPQLFSMETNKKKFYSLYKTFSGISLVQFMVCTQVTLTGK